MGQINSACLLAADEQPGNWMSHGRTYSEQRFSPLKQLDAENVGELGLAWYFDLPDDRGIEATPIVVDGVMYVTGAWSKLFALNAATGELLWNHDPEVPPAWASNLCCDVVNRGVAVWKGVVIYGTLDGRLLGLDAATGDLLWETRTTPQDRPYSITGAPRVIKGRVIIGNGGAELGVRGYVSAYDYRTGEMLWRFYTVPGDPAKPLEHPALEIAVDTWKGGEWWKVGGGGTVWDSMAYDAEADLLYIGTGNGSPWNRSIRSPGGGDNLFLSSIVALRPETGEYVWHYQTTPGESWDYTATQHMILAELPWKGEQRKVIMQAPKNGFFYVLDRLTGELLSAEPYTKVSWARKVDLASGRPVEDPEARYEQGAAALVWPHPLGGHNWHPMSYSPETGLVYIPAQEIPMNYSHDAAFAYRPGAWNTGVLLEEAGMPDDPEVREEFGNLVRGHVSAWDPIAGREVWRIQHKNVWNGGLLSTAGNLLFQGNADGELVAYRATDGERLWGFPAQTGIVAAPISYQVGDDQFVTVAAGWGGAFALATGELAARSEGSVTRARILAFRAGATGELPAIVDVGKSVLPAAAVAGDPDSVERGRVLYMRNCHMCHGDRAVSGSNVPDLRYMSDQTIADFTGIVLGGLRHQRGMPGFLQQLNEANATDLLAYLRNIAEGPATAQ
ncbi:MAG: PQQ-dependent dehydrogenase, methanol/ethanol family [Halioglobus sp.]